MIPPIDDDVFLKWLNEKKKKKKKKKKHLTARTPTPATRDEQPKDVAEGML